VGTMRGQKVSWTIRNIALSLDRCASKFGQQSAVGAPPADLFNIWRDDYMLSPGDAAAEVCYY